MSYMHPIIALDLARERSRAYAAQAERWRLASLAEADLGPGGPDHRAGGVRRAAASALRAIAVASSGVAGSAGRAASRLEGGAA